MRRASGPRARAPGDTARHAAGRIGHLNTLKQISFWFLRHGQTDWNAQNLAQGNSDIPLNATGLEQAHLAVPLLLRRGITTIVSSPLGRARATADIAAAALGLPVHVHDDLHEVEFGVKEGEPMLAQWFTDWVAGSYTPGGAESFLDLRRRVVLAINRALDFPAPVLVVAHGALFRALRADMGLDPNLRLANAIPQFCEPPLAGQTAWNISLATQTVPP